MRRKPQLETEGRDGGTEAGGPSSSHLVLHVRDRRFLAVPEGAGGEAAADASSERLTMPVIARIVEVAEEAELPQVADDPERTTRHSARPWSAFAWLTMVGHGLVTDRNSKHRSVVVPDPARCAGR